MKVRGKVQNAKLACSSQASGFQNSCCTFFDKATTHVLPFSISIRVFQRTDICLGDRYNDNARTVRTIIFTKTPDVEEFGLGTEKGVGRLARPRLFDIRDFQAVYVVDMLGLVLGTSYSQRLVSIQEQIIDL